MKNCPSHLGRNQLSIQTCSLIYVILFFFLNSFFCTINCIYAPDYKYALERIHDCVHLMEGATHW
jgi:hypothetical protein